MSGARDRIQTGDAYKDQVQNQWDNNPVGSHHARASQPHTLEWFVEVEKHRYQVVRAVDARDDGIRRARRP